MVQMEEKPLTFSVVWSDEDHIFVCRVAEYPSLACHGNTQEEALAEMKEVLKDIADDVSEEN